MCWFFFWTRRNGLEYGALTVGNGLTRTNQCRALSAGGVVRASQTTYGCFSPYSWEQRFRTGLRTAERKAPSGRLRHISSRGGKDFDLYEEL
eukprot:2100000-Rhodomonas_salina.5